MTLPRLLWIAMLALALSGSARAELVPVPPLSGHVIDQAGMLEPQQRGRLEAVLTDYEARTGSQIAVLLVKSTEPEQIEQYGIRVADAWKLGRKGVDDGVLLLVAKDNPSSARRLRIEAGRGVQGVLTDAQSKRILQDVIAPHFRQEQYYDGLVAGVGAIATLLNQEKFPAPPPPKRQAEAESDGGALVPLLLFAA
ncbi:MAG: YgcG family protein, partial [Telluria sp.]